MGRNVLSPAYNNYDRLMADNPKFDYGDEVQVTGGEHEGRTGCIVSVNLSSPSETYTVEFGDGSDAEIKETLLSARSDEATKSNSAMRRVRARLHAMPA